MVAKRAGLTALGLVLALAAPAAADDETVAFSKAPREMTVCIEHEGSSQPDKACEDGRARRLALKADAALTAALAVVAPRTAPLLLRDQSWLNEVANNSQERPGDDDEQAAFLVGMLEQRVAMLEAVVAGVHRAGLPGRWGNAFADAEVTAGGKGSATLKLSQHRNYDGRDAKRQGCEAKAVLTPAGGGWLRGKLEADGSDEAVIKVGVRLQGETLRVVLTRAARDGVISAPDCAMDQMTGTYFAVGPAPAGGAARAQPTPPFVAPSFDCTRPETTDQEEICADPELAANDVRLNAAWARLLPRLDAETKRHLIADQRRYVAAQIQQYTEFLHPLWDKTTYTFHSLGGARAELHHLQRERIALLKGFDEGRRGLEGAWLASDAMLLVERGNNGEMTASGWKWFQSEWKAGCDYEIKGRIEAGRFVSGDSRKNPDTLERDHATLVVNRLDDEFAAKRVPGDGESPGADQQKCKRRLDVSSTSRLFPVRPTPDIDWSRSIR